MKKYIAILLCFSIAASLCACGKNRGGEFDEEKFNYETLANIYEYRRNHKLDEWVEFCKWIESLPYSEIISCKEGE